MARPPEIGITRSRLIQAKLTPDEKRLAEAAKGSRSEGAYLRDLMRRDWEERGLA